MNLSKNFLKFLAFVIISIPVASYGAVTPVLTVASVEKPKSVMVADVNIGNTKIVSQKGNVFELSFDITNGKGLQSGVKYSVELIPDKQHYAVDEKVYDESLTIYENSKISKTITYTAPDSFGGDYNLVINSKNENGFPFSIGFFGKVKLIASSKSVSIINNSCYLSIDGSTNSKHYSLAEGAFVNLDQNMSISCDVDNQSGDSITLNPYFETRYVSSYGKVAPQSKINSQSASFIKGEKKRISLEVPKGTIPQFYNLKFTLGNSDIKSNTVDLHYVIGGASAILQKVSLDKDSYIKEETGTISIIWSGNPGNSSIDKTKQFTIKASIKDVDNKDCIDPIQTELVQSAEKPTTDFQFKTKRDCINPKVIASILDSDGKILAQNDFSFVTQSAKIPKSKNNILTIILGAIIAAFVARFIYIKKIHQ